jgi:hypothetical protein
VPQPTASPRVPQYVGIYAISSEELIEASYTILIQLYFVGSFEVRNKRKSLPNTDK